MPKRKLPSSDELVRLYNKLGTHQKVADWVNEQNASDPDFEPVTRAGVSVALKKAGVGVVSLTKRRYKDEIPWDNIDPRWQSDYNLIQLRIWARLNRDERDSISLVQLQQFERWRSALLARNAVIEYEDSRGFYPVEARPGVDTGLIRLQWWQIKNDAEKYEAWKSYFENKFHEPAPPREDILV